MRFPGKGVITLYNRIISRVSSDFDMLLEDTDIDTIILGKNSDYSDSVIRLVKQMTKQYVDDFLGALRERGIDLKPDASCLSAVERNYSGNT